MSRRMDPEPEGVECPELVKPASLPWDDEVITWTGVSDRVAAGAKIGRRGCDEAGPKSNCEELPPAPLAPDSSGDWYVLSLRAGSVKGIAGSTVAENGLNASGLCCCCRLSCCSFTMSSAGRRICCWGADSCSRNFTNNCEND